MKHYLVKAKADPLDAPQGDCDAGIRELSSLLGWAEELEERIEQYSLAHPQPPPVQLQAETAAAPHTGTATTADSCGESASEQPGGDSAPSTRPQQAALQPRVHPKPATGAPPAAPPPERTAAPVQPQPPAQ